MLRTAADPRSAAGAVRDALRSEDAQLPIRAIRTMEEVVDLSVARRRFQLTLMMVFAGAALLVASLGIYGVVSYSVTRRGNEIGIRMALGAQSSQLVGLVMRQGMTVERGFPFKSLRILESHSGMPISAITDGQLP